MLRVLVAEDSATARLLIVSLLSSDPEITVVGQARNGEEAVAMCAQLRPDVVTMDLQMPVMDGLEATRQIVSASQTPVIVVSSLDPAETTKSMLAFNAGALAVLAKPAGPGTPRFEKDCLELISTVKALSEHAAVAAAAAPEAAEPVAPVTPGSALPVTDATGEVAAPIEIIGVVAATGGPIALRAFFKALPSKSAAPVLIVQHIAMGFTKSFANWLQTATDRAVRLAVDQEPITPGTVYVAPDDRHLGVHEGVITVTSGPAIDGARPSGTALLASLAKAYAAKAAGVLLTGNGSDGVEGLRQLRDAGGAVFAQDQASCTTFETPRIAIEQGIVTKGRPVAEISHRIGNRVAGKPEHAKH
ncbi:MAG: chemotaxis-specific protein-glutamate methyltransferase CheB [Kofleriaceae bacterium]